MIAEQRLVATAINCIDGRVQLQVMEYLKGKLGVDFIDVVTDLGPDGILAHLTDYEAIQAIRKKVAISVQRHGSKHIAVIGHHDCAGNPVDAETHHSHIRSAVQNLRIWYRDATVFGLWINESWEVEEI